MVAMKVTNQVVTERILAGRAIMDPLAEETHSSRSLPVSRVRRPRLLSRCRDGTVVDYFRLPLSLGGSTSALLQRAHAVAWKFEGELCCWGANVVRGGVFLLSLSIVVGTGAVLVTEGLVFFISSARVCDFAEGKKKKIGISDRLVRFSEPQIF